MARRFALVLDSNVEADPEHWRASNVALTRSAVALEHDDHVIVIPRRPGDHRIESVTAIHFATGAEEPAGIYELS